MSFRVDGESAEEPRAVHVALEQRDLRDLQIRLSQRGPSSLSHSESCVMRSLLEASLRVHESLALRGHEDAKRKLARLEKERRAAMPWETAKRYLHQHTREMLGPCPEGRHIYIMVTAPSAIEADRAWMLKMFNAGMNVLRVNCAHEGEQEWSQVIGALDEARKSTGKECRVLMDLPGPKIRTGPIGGGRHIVTCRPAKDDIGKVTAPARVVVRRATAPLVEGTGPFLFVRDGAFSRVRKGDELRLRDARNKKRAVGIQRVGRDELVGVSKERIYVLNGALARLYRAGKHQGDMTLEVGGVQGGVIDVKNGDALVLTQRATDGAPPRRDQEGRVDKPARDRVHSAGRARPPGSLATGCCSTTDASSRSRRALGQETWRLLASGGAHASKANAKLRAEKRHQPPRHRHDAVPSLTRKTTSERSHSSRSTLTPRSACRLVRTPNDVRRLHDELDRPGRPDIGVACSRSR